MWQWFYIKQTHLWSVSQKSLHTLSMLPAYQMYPCPNCQHHRWVLPALKLHINRIIQCVLFRVWLLSLNILLMKFIHVVACSRSLFILISGKYSILWTHHDLFTRSTVDGYLSSFQFLAIKNKTATDILMPDSWWAYVRMSVKNIPRSGIPGWWGASALVDAADFPSSCIRLCSP